MAFWSGILDIETGGINRRRGPQGAPASFEEFLAATRGDFRNSSFFKQTIDKTGQPYQLLEFFARSNEPLFGADQWAGFQARPDADSVYLKPQPGFAQSEFSLKQNIFERSRQFGEANLSEEQFGQHFYQSLEQKVAQHGGIELSAWNGIYDLSFMESLTHRYESLAPYQHWFADRAAEGTFEYRPAEQSFFDVAWAYGQENPAFRERYFRLKGSGRVAQSVEDLRGVPAWSIQNIVSAIGRKKMGAPEIGALHNAEVDVSIEGEVSDHFAQVREALAKYDIPVSEAFNESSLLAGRDPEEFLGGIFNTPWLRQLEREELAPASSAAAQLREAAQRVAVEAHSLEGLAGFRRPLIALGIAAGASIALGLAVGKRRDRQTQIEALSHTGLAGVSRSEQTDFGSGWQGLNEDSPSNKAFYSTLALTGAYAGHRWALNNVSGWAEKTYDFLQQVEDRSPRRILRTLGASKRASQYLPDNLSLGRSDIFRFWGRSSITGELMADRERLGSHLERLLPGVDLASYDWDNPEFRLNFRRDKNLATPYLRMYAGEEATKHLVSFEETAYRTGASISERYGFAAGHQFREYGQSPRIPFLRQGAAKEMFFAPNFAKTEGETVRNAASYAGRELFSQANRLNRAINELSPGHLPILKYIPWLKNQQLGLAEHTFNSSFGLIKGLLLKRVLPIAGAVAGASYLDYLLGHRPSNAAYDAYAKGQILRAEATDRVPGLRSVTDWYAAHVPGGQYGPLALPIAGGVIGAMAAYSKVLTGQKFASELERVAQSRKYAKVGAIAGAILALPFLPGMLGSRKRPDELRAEFSGEKPVAIRAGRWWQMGTSELSGNRILMYRPHQYVLHKTRAADISLYGSEEEKWAHNPLLHPLRWLRDPNWLAKKHAEDRPYPMTSPAFSNVPLVGPLLAATIGRLVSPPRRMHEEEWDGSDYTLYTKSVEPKSPRALAPEEPGEEFDLGHVGERSKHIFEEAIGLPGFLLKTARKILGRPDSGKPDVMFEGSRTMTDLSRRYSELELGGLPMYHPDMGITSYSEPIRRMLQHERGTPRVNEIQNQMPSWLPNGDQYFFDFHKGDVYSRLPYGSVRLPGAGYEALHPELEGVDPEEYPDLEKLRILGDVAPYSMNFKQLAAKLGAETRETDDPVRRVEYENIVDRAREMRESTVRYDRRHTGATEEIEGTVRQANEGEIQLSEYPGRYFSFSGIDGRAAALVADDLGRSNEELGNAVREKKAGRSAYLAERLAPGTNVRLVLGRGGAGVTHSRAVVFAGGENVNRELLNRGYGSLDLEQAGAEAQALDGPVGRLMRRYSEQMSFQGDQSVLNPLRYLPSSVHSKLWNERTALESYVNAEVSGTRMRRWQRPMHDFVEPYLQGAARRLTGTTIITPETQERRDLDTLTDQLEYMRSLYGMSNDPEHRGQHSMQAQRTSIGANLFGETDRLPQTLPGRERKYFEAFLRETDPQERSRILAAVSKEMQETLLAQWTKESNKVRQASGTSVEDFDFSGRYVSQEDIDKLTDFDGKVVRVIDGDSLVIDTAKGKREVRLSNINTPEMTTGQGRVSKTMTEKLVLGEHVRLHEIGQDAYDRTVADVFTDDKRLLNYELLNSGHAEKDVYQNQDGSNQTKLSIGDYFRAREIAEFFKRRGLKLPSAESEAMASDIDYEDVKVKIVQWEGRDFHDFNIYDDRVAMLWRKPYLDGAVRELTAGDDRSVEETSKVIEQAIAQSKSKDRTSRVRAQQNLSHKGVDTVRVDVDIQPDKELKKEVRRNREDYA